MRGLRCELWVVGQQTFRICGAEVRRGWWWLVGELVIWPRWWWRLVMNLVVWRRWWWRIGVGLVVHVVEQTFLPLLLLVKYVNGVL
jgi:hypothetical protein